MGFWQGRKAGSIRRCPLHITAPRILQHPAQPRACLLLSHCWRLEIEGEILFTGRISCVNSGAVGPTLAIGNIRGFGSIN